MKNHIQKVFDDHFNTFKQLSDSHLDVLVEITVSIVDCYKNSKKVVLFGNGGSAADAQHIATELMGRYTMERDSLPALALTVNPLVMTAVANDYGYRQTFERQVAGLVVPGDVVIGLSTSGVSESVVQGILKAKEKGAKTIAFTGEGGGELKNLVHILFEVPSKNTARVQEVHMTAGHIICELVEQTLFGNND